VVGTQGVEGGEVEGHVTSSAKQSHYFFVICTRRQLTFRPIVSSGLPRGRWHHHRGKTTIAQTRPGIMRRNQPQVYLP